MFKKTIKKFQVQASNQYGAYIKLIITKVATFPITLVGSLEQKDPKGPTVCPAGHAGRAQGDP